VPVSDDARLRRLEDEDDDDDDELVKQRWRP